MRITTSMMTNNMMNNINRNKLNVSNLEQQYSTGKKIQRPSEDPIIAVRALKLRTNLSELKQYYEKNIPDANAWMDVTESALNTMNDLINKMNTYCVQGSSDTLTATDRNAVIQNLIELKDQINQEANSNYAGRYVFTGYKTDSTLVFTEEVRNLTYEITEKFTGKDIIIGSRVTGGYTMKDFDEDPNQDFNEAPKLETTYRIQLGYQNLDNIDLSSIAYSKKIDGEMIPQEAFTNINTISSLDPDAYNPGPGEINFLPETGELVFGEDAYEEFRTADEISLNYNKSSFNKGDIKPEHYFTCVVTDQNKPEVEPVTYTKTAQNIEYEINFNQKLKINTEASDVISSSLNRVIDEINTNVQNVIDTEKVIAEIEKRLADTNVNDEDKTRYQKMKEQLETELVLRKDVMQKSFARAITVTNQQQDKINVALADLGSRLVRLELTENRLSTQKVDFEELLSSNEDADAVETIIKYNSAQTLYNASLSAASKLVKTSLLDYIG